MESHPMTDLLSHIIMRTGLALSINSSAPTPGNVLILKDNDGADPDQFWSLLFWRPNAHILYNPHRNLYAAPRSLDSGAPVVLFELPPSLQFPDAHAWEIISGAPFVIRSAADDDLKVTSTASVSR